MVRKKTFVLLELIIAFALVSTCVLPFFRFPYRHMEKEIDLLFQMELERHARNRLVDIQERIYTDPALQRMLFADSIDTSAWEENPAYKVVLPGGIQRTFREKTFLYREKLKKENGGDRWALARIRVAYLNPKDNRKNDASSTGFLVVKEPK